MGPESGRLEPVADLMLIVDGARLGDPVLHEGRLHLLDIQFCL